MKKPCYSKIKFDCYNLTGGKLNVKVAVDDLKYPPLVMEMNLCAMHAKHSLGKMLLEVGRKNVTRPGPIIKYL